MNDIQETFKPEFTPSPEYLARAKRVQDAIELKKPDRIPILMGIGNLQADMGNITRQQLYDEPEKAQETLEKAALYFKPDMIRGANSGLQVSKALGDRTTKWPGYDLDPNGTFQFHEEEYMKSEDYDAFLEDPSDYAIRTYLPRAFTKLEGLSALPPLGMTLFGYYSLSNISVLGRPPVAAALEALQNAAKASLVEGAHARAANRRLAELGFPPITFMIGAAKLEAPFDFMSDTLRGMRGIFLDMLRQPEKLLAAEEKVKRFLFEYAVSHCRATGNFHAAFPLHRGSDGFVSLPQFEKFYWPQLKDLLLQLIDTNITCYLFYEGVWDNRLEYLAELPKGKTIGLFQASDIFKVKEVVGDTLCIIGGMPVSILTAGTVSQIREYTHELCERAGKGGGYIMSTGVHELEGCKPELVKAWVDATKEFGVYE